MVVFDLTWLYWTWQHQESPICIFREPACWVSYLPAIVLLHLHRCHCCGPRQAESDAMYSSETGSQAMQLCEQVGVSEGQFFYYLLLFLTNA